MKTFLIFDTETTGLIPKNARNPIDYPEDYPRVFQLAFMKMDEEGNILDKFSEFIKPDGWEVPKEPFWIKHGYSTEQCEELGVPMEIALNKFVDCMSTSDFLVAHNLDYDRPIILSEIANYQIPRPEGFIDPQLLCTMLCTINYVRANHSKENIEKYPFLKFSNKFPKLIELHEKLFNEGFDGAHDALVDVSATFRCLMKLKELGILRF